MIRSSFAAPAWAMGFFFAFFLAIVPAHAHDPLPVPDACIRPEAFRDVPHLRVFVEQACAGMAASLDHKTGAGTGQLVNLLEELSRDITEGDVRKAGLDYRTLKQLINEETGGRGLEIQVVAYKKVVDRANQWLEKSGFGFFRVVQHPKAALLEAYRNATSVLATGVTANDVKNLADVAYPDLKGHQLRLPIAPAELERASIQFKFPRYELEGDPLVPRTDLEPLPPESEPLEQDKRWYKKLQAVRFAITLGVMGTATASAAFVGDGHITPEAVTVFLAGLGLEAQFIGLSKYWRHFWAGWGFKGNALVNFSYGAILASVQHLTEYVQDIPSTFDANAFIVKTAVLGATFIASFGGMQVVSAKMKEEGEYSEGGAMWLESVGNIINNFGRFFAITAGVVGSSVAVGQLRGVEFGTNEAAGWAIQGAYFALITAPFWFKRLVGDRVRAGLMAYDLALHEDESHSYNRWLGGFKYACAKGVAWFTKFMTPYRVKLVPRA